jgi:hypothetical protein
LSDPSAAGIATSMMKVRLFALAIMGLGACSGGAADESGDREYTLDLATYRPGQDPAALIIANETLAFPLGVGPMTQVLSASAPGDLKALYTRVGCWVDPNEWIGTGGVAPADLPVAAPVRLVGVTIDQLGGVGVTLSRDQLAAATCVTYRSPGGVWHPFVRSPTVTLAGDAIRTEFTVDAAEATAVAIFLPTYTYVSKVAYRLTGE